jgi:hypothetical protein
MAATVVERTFALYLEGIGHKGIAQVLNAEKVPCPAGPHSSAEPASLRRRWQGSTVRAILCNPRYTGYAIYGGGRRSRSCLTRMTSRRVTS